MYNKFNSNEYGKLSLNMDVSIVHNSCIQLIKRGHSIEMEASILLYTAAMYNTYGGGKLS